jgi:hypothetical protein
VGGADSMSSRAARTVPSPHPLDPQATHEQSQEAASGLGQLTRFSERARTRDGAWGQVGGRSAPGGQGDLQQALGRVEQHRHRALTRTTPSLAKAERQNGS